MTRVEAIEVKAVEEREAWTLPASIFKPRIKECDAHQFLDSAMVRVVLLCQLISLCS